MIKNKTSIDYYAKDQKSVRSTDGTKVVFTDEDGNEKEIDEDKACDICLQAEEAIPFLKEYFSLIDVRAIYRDIGSSFLLYDLVHEEKGDFYLKGQALTFALKYPNLQNILKTGKKPQKKGNGKGNASALGPASSGSAESKAVDEIDKDVMELSQMPCLSPLLEHLSQVLLVIIDNAYVGRLVNVQSGDYSKKVEKAASPYYRLLKKISQVNNYFQAEKANLRVILRPSKLNEVQKKWSKSQEGSTVCLVSNKCFRFVYGKDSNVYKFESEEDPNDVAMALLKGREPVPKVLRKFTVLSKSWIHTACEVGKPYADLGNIFITAVSNNKDQGSVTLNSGWVMSWDTVDNKKVIKWTQEESDKITFLTEKDLDDGIYLPDKRYKVGDVYKRLGSIELVGSYYPVVVSGTKGFSKILRSVKFTVSSARSYLEGWTVGNCVIPMAFDKTLSKCAQEVIDFDEYNHLSSEISVLKESLDKLAPKKKTAVNRKILNLEGQIRRFTHFEKLHNDSNISVTKAKPDVYGLEVSTTPKANLGDFIT